MKPYRKTLKLYIMKRFMLAHRPCLLQSKFINSILGSNFSNDIENRQVNKQNVQMEGLSTEFSNTQESRTLATVYSCPQISVGKSHSIPPFHIYLCSHGTCLYVSKTHTAQHIFTIVSNYQ